MQAGLERVRSAILQLPAETRQAIETCARNKSAWDAYQNFMQGAGQISKTSYDRIGECFQTVMENFGQ